MNQIGKPPGTRLTLQDVHRAIETLAIRQAEIGVAVGYLLEHRLADDAQAGMLSDRVNQSVKELEDLAQSFLDKPF